MIMKSDEFKTLLFIMTYQRESPNLGAVEEEKTSSQFERSSMMRMSAEEGNPEEHTSDVMSSSRSPSRSIFSERLILNVQ